MPESPKVDLLFQYTRDRQGVYAGTETVVELGEQTSTRPPLHTVVTRPEWVRFVVDTIKKHPTREVSFLMHKRVVVDGKRNDTEQTVRLDSRTVEQIKEGSLSAEDLIL